jgi:hypothetical protein
VLKIKIPAPVLAVIIGCAGLTNYGCGENAEENS